MRTANKMLVVCSALTLFAVTRAARADELSDLKERFKERDARLHQLKTDGTLGENYQGYIEVPASAGEAAKPADTVKLMTEENEDRKKLYALLAKRDSVTPETVADRAAKRNFSRAGTGEWLKLPDGSWRQKK